MTEDEKEFAALVHVLEEAKRNHTVLSNRAQTEPKYEKEDGAYHTPTSMASYKRALEDYHKSKQEAITALASIQEATKQLDDWIPKPVHERLDAGVFITAPTPGGFVGLGKEDGAYTTVHAPTQISLEEAISNHLRSRLNR